uniref:Putative ovule protein n=1 Tax=Solanum chacoense TaxID=4108 RepID=A0A0V0GUD9_SOLCH
MTTGSLGLRSSGSYGSLQQQLFQNSSSPIQTTPPIPRKPPKNCLRRKRDCFSGSANSPLERMLGCCYSVLFLLQLFVGLVCWQR